MTDPTAAIGPAMEPAEEADHKRRISEQLADEADRAVQVIEDKIAGMQETLKAKKAEAKQYRSDARKAGKNGSDD